MTVDQLELDRSLDGLELPDWLANALNDPVFGSAFDRPFGLNDAVVFPARWLGRGRLVARIEERTVALNDSDVALSRIAGALLEQHCGTSGLDQRLADRWRAGLEEHENVRVAPVAIDVLRRLAETTDLVPAAEQLQPGVTAGLRNLPDTLRNLTRINISFHPSEIRNLSLYLSALATADLLRIIERVDMIEAPDSPGCVGIRLFIDPQPDHPHDPTLLDGLLALTAAVTAALGERPRVSDPFAIHIQNGLSLNQGFSLIKRYLEPFGLLSAHYDEAGGFRHAPPHLADRSGVTAWLQSLMATAGDRRGQL